MLKLLRKDCDPDSYVPKYFILKEFNIIGRGYKSHFRLHLPWLSRKHLTITKVDGDYVAEASGKTGVFVNNSKLDYSILVNGDRLTVGGCEYSSQKFKGPFIEYEFSKTVSKSKKLDGLYQPIQIEDSELISVSEVINGIEIEEKFSAQDFEETQFEFSSLPLIADEIPSPEVPGPSTSSSGASSSDFMAPKKQAKAAARKKSETLPCDENDAPGPVANLAMNGVAQKSFSLTTAGDVDNKSASLGAVGGPPGPLSSKQDTQVDDQWERFHRFQQTASLAKEMIEQKKTKRAEKSKHCIESDTEDEDEFNQGTSLETDGKIRRSGRAVKRPAKYLDSPDTDTDDDGSKSKEKFQPKTTRTSKSTTPEENLTNVDDIPNEIFAKEVEELPDIDEIELISEVKAPEKPSTSAAVQSKLNFGSKSSIGKGAKGKNAGNKKKGPAKRSLEDEDRLQLWKRPPYIPQAPHWVEILHGSNRGIMFNFISESLFQIKYLDTPDGEKPTGNIWNANEYKVVVKADITNLRYKLLTGDLPLEDYERLFKIIRKTMPTPAMSEFDQSCALPNDYTVKQPDEIKVELKQYQLNAMAWMKRLEDRVDREWTTSKLLEWEDSGMDLLFDVNQKVVYKPPVPRSKSTILGVKAKGGIYADQMGLGKTITLLSLFATNKSDAPKIPIPKKVQQQDQFYLETGATLVIAPSHLTGQWKDEITQHTENMKVQIITTKPQYDKIRYVDILEADVVIVSVQFLNTNKAFTEKPKGIEGRIEFMRLMMKPGINPLLVNSPNLCHFMWWRIVADEAHELLTYEEKTGRGNHGIHASLGLDTVSKLSSRFRWYVTGTPFPHGTRSLRAALKFIEMEVDDPTLVHSDGSLKVDQTQRMNDEFGEPNMFTYPLHSMIRTNFYVRNTKESVGTEYDVPEFVEELILLSMSPVERGVYDRTTNDIERRKLCCHLQIAARIQSVAGIQQKSLEEVRAALVDHNEKEIQRIQKAIESYEKDIKDEQKKYTNEWEASERRFIQARINRMKDLVKSQTEEMNKCSNALSYFVSIVPRIEHSADEPCVICLDTITNLTVTPCGHLFCNTCILPCIRQQGQCPTCRQNVTERALIQIQDPKMRTQLAKSEELRRLTEQYGTKMAYLIFYLRNLFESKSDARVIIFSQWDPLLHKIGETLKENSIQNVFVKGNVHVRNKAIMSFRRQKATRVIMLSLQHAASGTNLVEATHVILIDPVAGTKEEAVAIESQAIGRAHRMGQDKQISVVHMIMKDTIEHELYMRNKPDDLEQIEFNFEDRNTFGGPQIIRTKRTIAEPDQAVLRSALQGFQGENAENDASSRRRRSRAAFPARNRWGGGRNSWGWRRNLDMMSRMCAYDEMDESDYMGSDDDDERGEDNCVIS